MNNAYLFRVGLLNFILNIQSSSIGYSYPRIFVRFPDNSYLNVDLSIGAMFGMTESDWLSWYDDELIILNTIEEVLDITNSAGINWKEFENFIFKVYNENK